MLFDIDDDPATAQTALRVATAAVRADRDSAEPLSPAGCRRLARDLADHLDELAGLLQGLGLRAIPGRTGADDLRAVAEQLVLSAAVARHAGGTRSGTDTARRPARDAAHR